MLETFSVTFVDPENGTGSRRTVVEVGKTFLDAAHAAGSTSEGMKIGSHGKLVCFSFHPAKNLAMPTGGLIAINDPNYKKIKNK